MSQPVLMALVLCVKITSYTNSGVVILLAHENFSIALLIGSTTLLHSAF